MKIKKFNNLWTMGLILCAVILAIVYIAKIFFPEMVVEVAQVKNITRIGHYIDTHKWAWYVATTIMTFLSYYLVCCACCNKKTLNLKEIIIVILTILILYVFQEFFPDQYTSANISSMVLLPCIMKGNFKSTTIVFVSINFLQTITGSIRNISSMIADYNYATFLILMIDVYILQFLLYFMLNNEKGVK